MSVNTRVRIWPVAREAGSWCLLFGRFWLVLPLSLLHFVVIDSCGSVTGKLSGLAGNDAKLVNACGDLLVAELHAATEFHEVGLELLQLEDELHVGRRSFTDTVDRGAQFDDLCLDLIPDVMGLHQWALHLAMVHECQYARAHMARCL